jgi:predicted nucleic acid-binding protein
VATYFADTSFWIALSSKRDQHHQPAVAWNQFVTRTKSTIVTTEAVLLEWLNAMSDVSTRRVAAESYLRVRADAGIDVVSIQAELLSSAIQLYRDRPDKSWGLTIRVQISCLSSFSTLKTLGATRV